MAFIEKEEKTYKKEKTTGRRREELRVCYNAYRALRKIHLAKSPLCEKCLEEGIIRKATEVHHKVPILRGKDLREMMALATNPDNLMSLCKDCHEQLHHPNKINEKFLIK